MNNQNILNEGETNFVQPAPIMVTSDILSGPDVNAQSKIQKGGTLSTKVKCSCSLHRDNVLHAKSWLNYCPKCHRSGTLTFEKTRDCPEGMIRCTHCDADFCPVHGKEHRNRGAAYLRSA